MRCVSTILKLTIKCQGAILAQRKLCISPGVSVWFGGANENCRKVKG